MEKNGTPGSNYYRVEFLQGGFPRSIVFPSQTLANSFLKTLHSSRKAKLLPAPEISEMGGGSNSKLPPGTIVACKRGPRVRTWTVRKPRIMRRYPDFSKNVMNLPVQSAGFATTFPEEPPVVSTVYARHLSPEAGEAWARGRFGVESDGDWWPKDIKKAK